MNAYQGAKNIMKQIEKSIGFYSDQKPELIKKDDHYEIVWETGPYEWALNDKYGMIEEFGGEIAYDPNESSYFSDPKGIFSEPYNSYILCVYKD